jgi:hypothetical protein
MSTNARIGIKISGINMLSIYSHWDGYPSWVGEKLLKYFNTEEKVKELLSMGNVSIMGDKIGEKVDFHKFNSQENSQCLFYERDRGDSNEEAITHKIGDMDYQYSFTYLFKNGAWYVRKNKNFVLLTEKMCEDNY